MTRFDEKSRYRDVEIRTHREQDGTLRLFLARRFLPDPASLRVLATARLTESDRLDLIAHRSLGEATAFWRIADANAALDPDDLLSPIGRRLAVPDPTGAR